MNITKYFYLISLLFIALVIFGFVYYFNTKSYNYRQTEMPNNENVNILDLSNKGLTEFPKYVLSMTRLEELNLSYNQLSGAIPAEIRQLKSLKKLNLSHNLMTGLPAEIGQLTYLSELDLSYNSLTGLPYELGNLKNLKIFNLAGNNYSTADLNIITKNLPNLEVIK